MRKVTFYIDDLEYFHRTFNLTEEQMKNIFDQQKSFRAIYTLYGNGKNVDRYELTDCDGNKINRSDLNGFQRGVILNDCMAYFMGEKYSYDTNAPSCVVKIEDLTK